MGLLAPLFLLGGLFVALPIVLHLTRRQREPTPFPSFLLLRLQHRAARWKRRRFRNVPLLLLRCLALLLLALAFAEPVLEREGAVAGDDLPRDLAILVDRSLSMTAAGRFETARALASEEIESLAPGERAVLSAFEDRPVALTERTDDRAELLDALADLQPGDGGAGLATALGVASRLLPRETGRRREVVLVSDLQRSGFEDGRPRPSLAPGVALRVRSVTPPENPQLANAWIAAVEAVPGSAGRVAVRAEVRFAPGDGPSERDAEISLALAGRAVEGRQVTLPGDRALSVVFDPILRPEEPLLAEVRLGPPDVLPGDDRYRLVLHPAPPVEVGVVGAGARNVFLEEALGVGMAPAFALRAAPARGEAAVLEGLADARVALVEEPGRLDAGAAAALRRFLEAGGGVVAAMGARRIPRDVAAALEDVLPATPGGFVDRDPPGRLADFETSHPVFEPFAGPAGASLGSVLFHRYRTLGEVDSAAAVLARFDDGRPALLAQAVGEGWVFLFASSLDADWSELPRHAAFVPFTNRLFAAAGRHETIPLAYRVGDAVDPGGAFRLPPREAETAPEVLVESPGGERRLLTGTSALRLGEAGFFRARRPGGAEFSEIAANPPASESDLRFLTAEEVRIGAVARPAQEEEAAGAGVLQADPGPGPGLPLAGLGLLLLFAVLVIEARAAGGSRRSYTPGTPG